MERYVDHVGQIALLLGSPMVLGKLAWHGKVCPCFDHVIHIALLILLQSHYSNSATRRLAAQSACMVMRKN